MTVPPCGDPPGGSVVVRVHTLSSASEAVAAFMYRPGMLLVLHRVFVLCCLISWVFVAAPVISAIVPNIAQQIATNITIIGSDLGAMDVSSVLIDGLSAPVYAQVHTRCHRRRLDCTKWLCAVETFSASYGTATAADCCSIRRVALSSRNRFVWTVLLCLFLFLCATY